MDIFRYIVGYIFFIQLVYFVLVRRLHVFGILCHVFSILVVHGWCTFGYMFVCFFVYFAMFQGGCEVSQGKYKPGSARESKKKLGDAADDGPRSRKQKKESIPLFVAGLAITSKYDYH